MLAADNEFAALFDAMVDRALARRGAAMKEPA